MVLVDSRRGARIAVEHLMAHGHSRIAYVGGPQDIAQFQDRLQGWRDALGAGGFQAREDYCLSMSKMDVETGAAAARQLLGLAEPPTAVFTATDNLAFGILKACNRMGCSIPEHLAVVSFDNVPFGEIALVPLTSVDGSGHVIGQRAMRLMIERIESGKKDPLARADRVRMIIEPTLCIRRSCGCESPVEN
jgi:LacI family transcriptional regulator